MRARVKPRAPPHAPLYDVVGGAAFRAAECERWKSGGQATGLPASQCGIEAYAEITAAITAMIAAVALAFLLLLSSPFTT